ncbi:S-type Pyocin domain-containing protein, partial [Vibrio parahaemolyticus]
VGEATKGIKGDRLKSNPDYKQWRKQARSFQSEVQAISTQFGAPNYIKNIQANKVNNYLNVGKKQLYKAKDFSKAISGIEMTALYKKSMEFSKYLGRAAWVATIFGVRDNFIDIAKTCAQDEGFSEACIRSGVKNSTSIGLNVFVGEGIGIIGTRFAPTTYGLSIIPMAIGTYYWGLYGGEVSNVGGELMEYLVFDAYDDTVEFIHGVQR